MNDFDYAIPVSVTTVTDNNTTVVQVATMVNPTDAVLYAKSCRRYGADTRIAPHDPTLVMVIYKKDSEGKIGPTY